MDSHPYEHGDPSAHGAVGLPAGSAAGLPGRPGRVAAVLCGPGAGIGADGLKSASARQSQALFTESHSVGIFADSSIEAHRGRSGRACHIAWPRHRAALHVAAPARAGDSFAFGTSRWCIFSSRGRYTRSVARFAHAALGRLCLLALLPDRLTRLGMSAMEPDQLSERLWNDTAPMEEWTAAVSEGAVTSISQNIISIHTTYFCGCVTVIRTTAGLVLIDTAKPDTQARPLPRFGAGTIAPFTP